MKSTTPIVCLLLLLTPLVANAYQVYPSTGHMCKEQLLDLESYQYVREHADGMWLMPWNIRSDYLTQAEWAQVIGGFKSSKMVAEINDTHMNWDSPNPHPKQLIAALDAGAEVHTVMAYNEGVNGSVLTQENIDHFKSVYGGKHKIVSNVRRWTSEAPFVFEQLDGICFEFQIPEKFPGLWDQVVEGILWADKNNKVTYLLTPPGHNDYHLNRAYIKAYQKFFAYLREKVGDEILKKDTLIFCPSNYSIHKTDVQMTPEVEEVNGKVLPANTAMGAAYWLLQQPLYLEK